jgi:hypothetical protein
MPHIDFGGISLEGEDRKRDKARRRLLGPGKSRRYSYFRRFMPSLMAHRISRTFNISKKGKYYYDKLFIGLGEIDSHIIEAMNEKRMTREKAISYVWYNITKAYKERYSKINTWEDVLRRQLDEWLSPGDTDE